jgi:hypothetical protein
VGLRLRQQSRARVLTAARDAGQSDTDADSHGHSNCNFDGGNSHGDPLEDCYANGHGHRDADSNCYIDPDRYADSGPTSEPDDQP